MTSKTIHAAGRAPVLADTTTIHVGLVDLGVDDVRLSALADRLNGLRGTGARLLTRNAPRVSEIFHFRVIGALDIDNDVDSSAVPKQHYYDAAAIVRALERFAAAGADVHVVIGITSLPLACESPAGSQEWDYDYFGVWPPQPGGQPLHGRPTAGVISTSLWVRRFETLAYRTTDQFLEHAIVALLGDVLSSTRLTHARFRRCVFDYNEDLDSIVDSVRRARLCTQCETRLASPADLGELANAVGSSRVLGALQAILKDVRTPRWRTVFRVLQNDGVFSVLILGVVAAMGINLLSGWIEGPVFQVALPILLLGVLVAWITWQYLRPGPPLRG